MLLWLAALFSARILSLRDLAVASVRDDYDSGASVPATAGQDDDDFLQLLLSGHGLFHDGEIRLRVGHLLGIFQLPVSGPANYHHAVGWHAHSYF